MSDEPPRDFRSARMGTPEGRGLARQAWEKYKDFADKALAPVLGPVILPITKPGDDAINRQIFEDMIGFWVMWHLYGGFEGLERFGMHKATIWRKVGRFRRMFNAHPDEYQMPGIKLDLDEYWKVARARQGLP
jgi:hypothetical protein